MQSVIAACKFLTLWNHLSASQPSPEATGSAAVWFPLVGLLLGLLVALLNYALGRYLDSEILTVFLVAILVLATAGVPLYGVKKTFDSLRPVLSRSVNPDETIAGFAAILFVLLFKITAIDVLGDKIALSLLVVPMFARWALVLCLFGYQDQCDERARRVANNVRFSHLLISTSVTLALAVYLLGRKGLWIGLWLSVSALLARSLLYRRHAVMTLDNFGALIELTETFGLILLASL